MQISWDAPVMTSAWIGPLGGLVPVRWGRAFEMTRAPRYSVKQTIGGLPRAQVLGASGRVWTVEGDSASSAEIAAIRSVAGGVRGPGPFVWVTDQAQVQNLLTPVESWCREPTVLSRAGVTAGGGFSVSPGSPRVGSYIVNRAVQTGTVPLGQLIPVVPGHPVHGSAWVSGPVGARLYIMAYDAAGSLIAPDLRGGDPSKTAGVSRLTVFRDDLPTQTAWITLAVSGADQVTMPQVTWRSESWEWGEGLGCRSAVITDFAETPVQAGRHSHGGPANLYDFNLTVTEVS